MDLTDKKVLEEALKQSGKSQADLARDLDVNRSTISTNMRRDNISVDVFARLLTSMGYTVMVGRNENGTFVPMWQVDSVKPKREQRMRAEKNENPAN